MEVKTQPYEQNSRRLSGSLYPSPESRRPKKPQTACFINRGQANCELWGETRYGAIKRVCSPLRAASLPLATQRPNLVSLNMAAEIYMTFMSLFFNAALDHRVHVQAMNSVPCFRMAQPQKPCYGHSKSRLPAELPLHDCERAGHVHKVHKRQNAEHPPPPPPPPCFLSGLAKKSLNGLFTSNVVFSVGHGTQGVRISQVSFNTNLCDGCNMVAC